MVGLGLVCHVCFLLTQIYFYWRISVPVPFKHSTETAYMVVLGLVICLAGFAAALLPPLPLGMKYWAIGLLLAVLYPLVLARTFKSNRADYEFRMLHWFPAGIFVVWFLLHLALPRIHFLRILALGFFFLWSLPLVALGIAFIIIFALHVLRRSRIRVTVLALILALFTTGAILAEGMHINPKLQASIYPKNFPTFASARRTISQLGASLWPTSGSSGLIAMNASSSSSLAASATTRSSSRSVFSSLTSSTSQSAPQIIGEKKPVRLPQSGPESMALIAATLLAGYFGVVHARAAKRV